MPEIGKVMGGEVRKGLFPFPELVVDAGTLTNEEWLDYRKKGIGGSDAAVIMFECTHWNDKRSIYHEKIGTPKAITDEDDDKWFIFQYGHTNEPLVAEMFKKTTGFEVYIDTNMYRHPEHTFMQANVDRVVILPDGRKALLECKTTTFFNKDVWANGAVPRPYLIQCRHYMAVMDVDVIFIACLYGNTPSDFVCRRIERDKEAEEELIEAEKDFWENNILSGIEPDPCGVSELDLAFLRRYGGNAVKEATPISLNHDEGYKRLADEYMALDRERKLLNAKADTLGERQKSLQVKFAEEMGTTCYAEYDIDDSSYYSIEYTPRSRKTVDTDRLELAHPEAFAACVKVNPESSRVFSIKIKRRKAVKVKVAS